MISTYYLPADQVWYTLTVVKKVTTSWIQASMGRDNDDKDGIFFLFHFSFQMINKMTGEGGLKLSQVIM